MGVQVNIRLDEKLLKEIDALTGVLHLSRTEWLRMKIALAVKDDTLRLSEAIALEYAKGNISKEELKNLLGRDADDIIYVVKHLEKGKRYIDSLNG